MARQVINFYKFFRIEDPEEVSGRWYRFARSLALRGTFLMAEEGANCSLAGEEADLNAMLELISEDVDLSDVLIKRMPLAPSDKNPFPRLRVRIKKEIVTTDWPVDRDFNQGTFLSADEFHELASDPNTVLIDTRNDYEYHVGTFQGAIGLPLKEFDRFAEHLDDLQHLKDKRIVTFCTGGIRCEKAVPLLKQHGFENVYQLKGGIIEYFNRKGQGRWRGECFVFDYRCSITPELTRGSFDFCEVCGQPSRDGKCVQCDEAEYASA